MTPHVELEGVHIGKWKRGLWRRWRYHPESCYGSARRVYWDESGDKFLFHGASNQHEYVEIYSVHRDDEVSGRPNWAPFGGFAQLPHESWNSSRRSLGCCPWRPGTESFLINKGRRCSLLEANAIAPKRIFPDGSLGFLFQRLLISKNWSKAYAENSPPLSSLDGSTLSVEGLGAQVGGIDRLAWHPSGLFLAVGTSKDGGYNVRIVHFESGAAIVTITDADALGWSSHGGTLLLDFGPKEKASQSATVRRFSVWDALQLAVRPLTHEESASKSFAPLIAGATLNGNSNADGTLVVRDNSIIRVSDGAVVAALSANDAEWSPTDPARLATVGGSDVCVWDLAIER